RPALGHSKGAYLERITSFTKDTDFPGIGGWRLTTDRIPADGAIRLPVGRRPAGAGRTDRRVGIPARGLLLGDADPNPDADAAALLLLLRFRVRLGRLATCR